MSIESGTELLQVAATALERYQPEKAAKMLAPFCKSGAGDSRHWFLYGTALGMAGDSIGAEYALQKSLELEPSNPQAQVNLSQALMAQNRLQESVSILQQVLSENADHFQAHVALVNTWLQMKEFEKAKSCCSQLLSGCQEENKTEALLLMGDICKEQGGLGSAEHHYNKALERNSGLVRAWTNKGLVLKMMGRNTEALACFETATKLMPDNTQLWFIKGLTQISLRKLEQAAEDLEQAFNLDPKNIAAGSQLANVYRHLRHIQKSIEVSRRILQVDPNNAREAFYIQAFENSADNTARRIPREVAEATYSDKNVGRQFEASLKGGLEYRVPDVLDEAVRTAFDKHPDKLDILELGCGTGLCGSRFVDIAQKLVGTDLSPIMLDVAREKNAYTNLYVADLIDVLTSPHSRYDLIIAMDVLCYFGDLSEIFSKCHNTLHSEGIFAFSVEKPDGNEAWQLHPYGHFVHSLDYIRQVGNNSGFHEVFMKEMILRQEAEPRPGYVCLYQCDSYSNKR